MIGINSGTNQEAEGSSEGNEKNNPVKREMEPREGTKGSKLKGESQTDSSNEGGTRGEETADLSPENRGSETMAHMRGTRQDFRRRIRKQNQDDSSQDKRTRQGQGRKGLKQCIQKKTKGNT